MVDARGASINLKEKANENYRSENYRYIILTHAL
jgi:hypothetical protein